MTLHNIHRQIAYILAIPLLIVFLSGFSYRVSRNVFGFPKESVAWLLAVHQMNFLGLQYVWPVFVGSLTLVLIATGLPYTGLFSLVTDARRLAFGLASLRPNYSSTRSLHRYMASLVAIPLFITASTGMMYAIIRYWIGFSKDSSLLGQLLFVHQGAYLGDPAIYVCIMAAIMSPLLFTGFRQLFLSDAASRQAIEYTLLHVNRAFEVNNNEEIGLTSEEDSRMNQLTLSSE